MARKSKVKAGSRKHSKKPARRAAPAKKPAAQRQAAPPKGDPVIEPGKTLAIVTRGSERIPVQLKDEAHLAKLRQEHGADSIEVQS